MTEDRRQGPPYKGRLSSPRPRGPAVRPRSHPPSKQLTEKVPDTESDSQRWWMRIRSSRTPGRWGALPQAPDTEDDYDYTKHDFPLWWASIRLDDLVQMARANGPALWTMHAALAEGHWESFLRERAEVKAGPERTDWSQVPAPKLMVFVEGAATVRMGIRNCLSSKNADLPFAEQSAPYLRALTLWGTMRGGPFPLRPALEAVRLLDGAPYAVKEMFRRGSKHVGFYMFLLLISGRDGTKVARALEGLRKVVYGNLPSGTRERIGQVNATSGDTFAALKQAMDVQAFETGVKRWGRHGPRGLVLRWLAGKLNIAPLAIANDLQDADRASLRRLSREKSSVDPAKTVRRRRSRDGIRRPDEEKIQVDIVEERSRQAAEVLDYVEPFLAQHPRHRRGIEALLSEEPLATLATRYDGVTVQTVINWKTRALNDLQKWAQELKQP
jgi:hypothetical protein